MRISLGLFVPRSGALFDVRKFGKETDFKRVAQPEELSPAYVFLASPVCAGIVLPVTGSVTAI